MNGDKRFVVLITGAAGGIGSAVARRYAREGASLALLDVDEGGLTELAGELAGSGAGSGSATEVVTRVTDITDEEACHRAVGEIVDTLGGIDVLVNNAGRTHLSFVDETDASVFRRVMDVNFFGALYMTQAALPSLVARRGAMGIVSSVAGFAPLSGRSGYAASKHALHGLFDSLRGELREQDVGVSLICPSFTRTDIGGSALGADGGPAVQPRTEMGRMLDPQDVAEAVYEAVRRRRRLVVLPAMGKLAYLLSHLVPGLYERIMVGRLAREQKRGRREP